MEQRLSLVTLAVADVTRSRSFYEKGLEWSPGFTDDDIAFYQLPGMVFGLWSKAAFAADLKIPEARLGGGGIGLAYNVRERADVDATIAQARTAGARVIKAPHDTEWGGYSGTFSDPDGHLWEIAWNPGWKLAKDGAVRM